MKSLKNIYALFCSLFIVSFLCSQNPVNAYANVSGIAGSVLSVNNVNETYHTFEDGDYIIIMQMQDNVIGTNTTNAVTFGDLSSIQSAGLFEVAQISSHTEASSLPTNITLVGSLVNTYNINANASVQIITFRFLGINYTSSANIGTLAWNGTIGGVTAFSVTNVLTLNHSVVANGCGFAGGLKNTPNGYTACDNSTYATSIATRYAGKGDGIYKRTVASYAGARGKILNGGGGGNDVNSGGGGGGNYTAGGSGGSGWVAAGTGCSPIAGGLGGLSLSASISGSRVFMGGGGGGGHENDAAGTLGGSGGGIIMIKAGTFSTTSCAAISISANGITPANASNDGAGGAGAGGTIIFNVGAFNIAGACPLTVSANGGNGGNSNAASSGAHGGGGGGGQGVVIYSSAQPATNVTTNTIPGTGGVSCSGCSTTQNGSVGAGTSNSGIIVNGTGPLPIELISFEAQQNKQGQVVLHWQTSVEKNSAGFILQRMGSDQVIKEITEIKSKGNNSSYSYVDTDPAKTILYYRLKEVDKDGSISLKHWIEINTTELESEEISMYPNPIGLNEQLVINYFGENASQMEIEFSELASGKIIRPMINNKIDRTFSTNISHLSSGAYTVKIKVNEKIFYRKLLVLN